MNTYAVLGRDGRTVANVIIATAAVAKDSYPRAIRIDTISPVPGVGWLYEKGVFSPPR